MSIGSEERDAVLRVMDRGILSGYKGNWSEAFYGGEEIRALEKEWQSYFGVKHAIACNSATSGLWLACAAVGLQQNYQTIYSKLRPILFNTRPGMYDSSAFMQLTDYVPDEVIVTPYSMTCSASMPLLFGAKPVFADIEPDYFCLDPKSIEERITPQTKAIIVVDLFGQPYDADAINAIAKKHGIMVIEDAAQAAGATYMGRYAGTLGDIGVFSLNVHKPITCGEGGVVVTDNDELAMRIRLSMNHAEAVMNDAIRQSNPVQEWALTGTYTQLVGMNLRMTELSAAVAREQLKKLDGILKQVREFATPFRVKVRPGCEHAYYRYATNDENINPKPGVNEVRVPILEALYMVYNHDHNPIGPVYNWVNFNIKRHYITPIHHMPLFRKLGYDQESCPVCDEVDGKIVLAWLKGMG